MRLQRGFPRSLASTGCILTIGNFDGVHLGHQAVLTRMQELSLKTGLPIYVIVFEPQPQEYFQGDQAPSRLTRLREKCRLFSEFKVDQLIMVRFNDLFSRVTAEDFIEQILIRALKVHTLIVGHDFRFGYQRQGDFSCLERAAQQYGFILEQMPAIYDAKQQRISSTSIRLALATGNLEQAIAWLGHPYSWIGKVIQGDQRGRTLGFPTANLRPNRRVSPLRGVFAVTVKWQGNTYEGMANLGKRPTVGGLQFLLEVHIFEFQLMIYGEFIEVQFEHQLRSEREFSSLDALRQQIQLDKQHAQSYFASKRIASHDRI